MKRPSTASNHHGQSFTFEAFKENRRGFSISVSLHLAAGTLQETFDESGEHEFTVPAGVTEITVEVWAAGGRGERDHEGKANNSQHDPLRRRER